MLFRRFLIGFGLAVVLSALTAALLTPAMAAGARRAAKKHLLVVTVTKGFRHSSIGVAEKTIESLGESTNSWDTDFVRNDEEMAQKMTAEALKRYDGIVFANTTGVLPLPDPQAFLDFIKSGHGFAAMHSGSDTFHEWPGSPSGSVSEYVTMLGGEFLTHHSQCAVFAHIADPKHPAVRPLATAPSPVSEEALASHDAHKNGTATSGKTWTVFDEIYLLKNNDPAKVHTLLWLDKYPNDGSADANKPELHLLSWVKSYGTGRVFYTELGHREEVWQDPLYQKHITGGLQFILGLKKGDTTPGNIKSIN